MASKIVIRPMRAFSNTSFKKFDGSFFNFISSCTAVTPAEVPATLKSMSPRASSIPAISVRISYLLESEFDTSPIATPATGALIGTPASIKARVEPQVAAWDVDPFDARTSETSRITYGNSSNSGRTASSAFSASIPWPISRRPAVLRGRASPTE